MSADVIAFPLHDGAVDALTWLEQQLKPALGSFVMDPPDDEYQRRYLGALQAVDQQVRAVLRQPAP